MLIACLTMRLFGLFVIVVGAGPRALVPSNWYLGVNRTRSSRDRRFDNFIINCTTRLSLSDYTLLRTLGGYRIVYQLSPVIST